MTIKKTSSARGGARPGAGRKAGSGNFGEPTTPVRVPLSLVPTVRALLRTVGKVPPHPALRLPATTPAARPLPYFSSRVAAGLPAPADDHQEEALDLNQALVRHPEASFIVQVQGESMTGAGIQHGDLLVVDRALEPKTGAIVIAVVNGELTVKRLRIEGGRVSLVPENPAYPSIELGEGIDLQIWGVVAHVIHSF